MIIQEDGATPHNSIYKNRFYNLAAVFYLLWVGNSPDLNMIEPAWPHLKWITTCKGVQFNPKNTGPDRLVQFFII